MAFLAGLAAAPAAAEDCAPITLTAMNGAFAAAVIATAKVLTEAGYGCPATTRPSSSVPALVSIAENGRPDIATGVWVNATPLYGELVAAGRILTAADVLSDGGIEGRWIPASMLEDHPERATVEGLAANAALFEGRFSGCPEGWACKSVTENLAVNFDLVAGGFSLCAPGSGETRAAAPPERAPRMGHSWAPSARLGE